MYPEHGSRRVLSAINAELEHRTPAELAERIASNWEHWRYRITAADPIRDPMALTIRLTRGGLDCPDIRCEDGRQLDLDAPCKACAMTAVEHAAGHAAKPDQAYAEEWPELQLNHGVDVRRTSPVAVSDETTRYTRGAIDTAAATAATAKAVDGRRYAALARSLLRARTAAEREEDFRASKQATGLDKGQVTTWTSWHRWSTAALAA